MCVALPDLVPEEGRHATTPDMRIGVVTRAINDIFAFKNATKRSVVIRMSYVEIYNEVIRDLLNPTGTNLKIHENLEKGVFIGGLREVNIDTPEQILELIERGEAKRHVSATQVPLSLSVCVLSVYRFCLSMFSVLLRRTRSSTRAFVSLSR